MNNHKITYGEKDLLTEEDFLPQNAQVRMSLFVSMDTMSAIKKAYGEKWKEKLCEKLREIYIGESNEHPTI